MPIKIYVVGHLNIDYIISREDLIEQHTVSHPLIGGTAFNAAKALKARNFEPIIVGKIGNDHAGQLIKQAAQKAQIACIIKEDESKPTGSCRIIFSQRNSGCQYLKDVSDDANQFDLKFLKDALADVNKTDVVLVAGHFLTHRNVKQSMEFIDFIYQRASSVILDVVPHNIYQRITLRQFNQIVRDRTNVIIAEFSTLMRLVDPTLFPGDPTEKDWQLLSANYRTEIFVIRYGPANISKQQIRQRQDHNELRILEPELNTGFANLNFDERRGFGDILTAKFISKLVRMS